MPTTSRGYEYPASTGHDRIWEHFETLADDIDTDVEAVSDVANAATVRVGKTAGTSDSSATSGTTELAIDQVTISAVNGKTYRITWNLQWAATSVAASERHFILLRLGSGTGGTQLTYITVVPKDTAAQEGAVVIAEWTASSTGSQTFTGSMRRSNGSGNISAKGGATNPRLLVVDQIS